ncbi:hypothetical protein HYY73_06585 [Candidatus Woesearchaeota archaeon]|nr:hypothetical protein [Candidatus Woesearchaeota archaeon]
MLKRGRLLNGGLFAVLIASFILTLVGFAAAHGDAPDGHEEEVGTMLDESIRQNTLLAVFAGSALLAILVAAAIFVKRKKRKASPLLLHLLFWPIIGIIVCVTAYVAGSTIYLNVVSETGGPVHWHADYEIWKCGEQHQLADPEGFSNRVGETVLHEHNDNRMHIEGVVVDYGDVSISSFFRSVGGELRNGWLALPTSHGLSTMKDGDSCGDGSGTLQVFVWKTADGRAVQEKLDSYVDYVPSPHGNVPPGDCIIFEFDSAVKEKTERMCESYEVALKLGKVTGDSNGG